MRPRWIVYKNNIRMGESITWCGALNILIKQENITEFKVKIHSHLVLVDLDYKIVKES